MLQLSSRAFCPALTKRRSVRDGFILEIILRGPRVRCALLILLLGMLSSSGLEAHLGVVPGLGRELGAVILREDAVPAQQLG